MSATTELTTFLILSKQRIRDIQFFPKYAINLDLDR